MPRSKSFVTTEALDTAIELFTERGYDGLTMEELARRLHTSRSSVYVNLGDKDELFVQSLRRYRAEGRGPATRMLCDGGSPRAAIASVFEQAISCADAEPPGEQCLFINTALASRPACEQATQIVGDMLRDLELHFGEAVARAQAAAEIADHIDPTEAGRSLLSLYLGLRVLVRSGVGEPVLRAVVHQVDSQLPAPA